MSASAPAEQCPTATSEMHLYRAVCTACGRYCLVRGWCRRLFLQWQPRDIPPAVQRAILPNSAGMTTTASHHFHAFVFQVLHQLGKRLHKRRNAMPQLPVLSPAPGVQVSDRRHGSCVPGPTRSTPNTTKPTLRRAPTNTGKGLHSRRDKPGPDVTVPKLPVQAPATGLQRPVAQDDGHVRSTCSKLGGVADDRQSCWSTHM
mmetsp:Transcript_81588/g.166218  ORF Transcript_81588/g.166218 Transcript_81588/m.166218 type:complete len:202 (+) Transcript_81588:108-713(+)